MKEEFSELAYHFDEKLREKFDELKQRFFDLENKISTLERKIDELQRNKPDKHELEALTNTLNDHIRKADVSFQEVNKLTHKLDDCERQIIQLSDRIK